MKNRLIAVLLALNAVAIVSLCIILSRDPARPSLVLNAGLPVSTAHVDSSFSNLPANSSHPGEMTHVNRPAAGNLPYGSATFQRSVAAAAESSRAVQGSPANSLTEALQENAGRDRIATNNQQPGDEMTGGTRLVGSNLSYGSTAGSPSSPPQGNAQDNAAREPTAGNDPQLDARQGGTLNPGDSSDPGNSQSADAFDDNTLHAQIGDEAYNQYLIEASQTQGSSPGR